MKYLLITTNLDGGKRKTQSTELLRRIGVEPEYVWGVEKGTIPQSIKNSIVDPGGEGLTEGELAVALAHAKALRVSVITGEPAVIIEDDFRLWHEGGIQPADVREAWNTIPEDTDFCSFAKWHVWNPELEIIDENEHSTHKKVKLPTYGNQCYYVSAKAARHFYDICLPIRCAADVIYRYPQKDLIFRHHYPELIWHADNDSIKD